MTVTATRRSSRKYPPRANRRGNLAVRHLGLGDLAVAVGWAIKRDRVSRRIARRQDSLTRAKALFPADEKRNVLLEPTFRCGQDPINARK
jgi:hypothetical protein